MHDVQSMLPAALSLLYLVKPLSYVKHTRLVMDKNKQRAVGILVFLGSILVLLATWDFPASPSLRMK